MFSAVLKLIYLPGVPDLVLPEYSELPVRLQKQDGPELFLPPANGPVVS
jgi:hypothetical protein